MAQKLWQSGEIIFYAVGYTWLFWTSKLQYAPKHLKLLLGLTWTIGFSTCGGLLLKDLWG